jgi:tetratricopeptide (TPR) repeat protein
MHLKISRWDEEKSWAATIMGEIFESGESYAVAAEWYKRSLAYHPGILAAMRLARVYFHMGLWAETVSAYELGLTNRSQPQFLDGGQVYEDATKIFAAAALRKLGRLKEAADLSSEASRQFPGSPALAKMAEQHSRDVERNRS